MHLKGSCHCGAVTFQVDAPHPVPFMRCYCTICRKTAGTGGYAINLGADNGTLKVKGKSHLRVYRAVMPDGSRSPGERHFCGDCGTALWLWDPRWPDLVHPHAGAIDTPLPVPPENVHMMLDSKAPWVAAEGLEGDPHFDTGPDFSLAEWHAEQGLASP